MISFIVTSSESWKLNGDSSDTDTDTRGTDNTSLTSCNNDWTSLVNGVGEGACVIRRIARYVLRDRTQGFMIPQRIPQRRLSRSKN